MNAQITGLVVAAIVSLPASPVVVRTNASRSYRPPQSGWLYVVDSARRAPRAKVLMVNPRDGTISVVAEVGLQPDIALSSNGARLFVASSAADENGGSLDIIDTANGQITATRPNARRWTTASDAYSSNMALSRDGRWLFQFKVNMKASDPSYVLQTFDTERLEFLPETVALPLCESAVIVPSVSRNELSVVCARTRDIRTVTLDEHGGGNVSSVPTGVPSDTLAFPALAFSSPSGSELTIVTGNGRVVMRQPGSSVVEARGVVDHVARRVDRDAVQEAPKLPNASDWLANRWFKGQPAVASPDGLRLYVAVSPKESLKFDSRLSDQVVVFDPRSLERTLTIAPRQPFTSMTLSVDGGELYLINTMSATLATVDSSDGRELKVLQDVGESPAFAVPVP